MSVLKPGREQIFGYASLAAEPGITGELDGWRRSWSVAMDNCVDLPGYKYYIDAGTGERPDVCVAFLSLERDDGRAVNGRLFEVGRQMLSQLDARERNYERRESLFGERGRAWVYQGHRQGKDRAQQARRENRLVIDANYFRRVRDHFAALGQGELERFDATTDPPPVPLLDLRRVDLPTGG